MGSTLPQVFHGVSRTLAQGETSVSRSRTSASPALRETPQTRSALANRAPIRPRARPSPCSRRLLLAPSPGLEYWVTVAPVTRWVSEGQTRGRVHCRGRWVPLVAGLASLGTALGILFTTGRCWPLWAVTSGLAGAAALAYAVVGWRLRPSWLEYSIVRRLGGGGMSDIYEAHHPLLGRAVALELVREDHSRSKLAAELEASFGLVRRLKHPSTVRMWNYGHTREGRLYCTMELVEGVSLARAVSATGPVPPGRAIHLLRQICGSLGEAHDAGLVHRDIKPANVMLTRHGFDFVKVIDFDLVAAVGRTGARPVGTPAYMAPEALATPDQVDSRTDVYAIGAVGFFLLTGREVFPGKSCCDVFRRHLNEPPPRPSELSPRRISDDLEHLVVRCLAKDPPERPRDASELERLLAECVDADTWTAAQARAWWVRHAHVLDGEEGTSQVEPRFLAVDP